MRIKSLLFALIMLFAGSAYAQTEKGNYLISARSSLNFNYSKSKVQGSLVFPDGHSQADYAFSISPALGAFVVDNLAFTFQVSYSMKDEDTNNTISQLSLLPGLIYYVPTGVMVRPFLQVGGGYVDATIKKASSSGGYNIEPSKGYALAGGLGIAFFVKENISIDLTGQYMAIKPFKSGVFNSGSFSSERTSGISGSIGFSFFF